MRTTDAVEERQSLGRSRGGARVHGCRGPVRWAAPLVAALLIGGLLPHAASAQPGQDQRVDQLTSVFSGMREDTGVRVMTPMLFIEHGAFRSLEPESVRIEYGDSVVPVDLGDIRSVQVERHHPVKGMLWGAGSGLLVGAVSGLLVGSFYCDQPVSCESEERRGAVIGGTALGVAGGVVGFLIGKYQVSWSPVFP